MIKIGLRPSSAGSWSAFNTSAISVGIPAQLPAGGFFIDFSTSTTAVALAACEGCDGFYSADLSSGLGISEYAATYTNSQYFFNSDVKSQVPFSGGFVTDRFCLASTSCLSDFDFFTISNTVDPAVQAYTTTAVITDWPNSGIIGLAPSLNYPGRGPSIVEALANQGLIGKAIASVFMSKAANNSFVYFGDLPEGLTVGSSETYSLSANWSSTMTFTMPSFALNGVQLEG